ncbi:MAG: response regulator, partial [Nitrospirales bacterium]
MAATVLVVDDEKDLVELVKYHLEKEGLKCLEARDGETALQVARERTPDLIVLDMMLPGVDGLEVCRKLRKDPKTSSIAI